MPEWLLTDDEIKEAIKLGEKFLRHYDFPLTIGEREIVKAQDAKTKKKLLEWIEKKYSFDLNSVVGIHMNRDEWKALKKEMGGE